MLGGARRCSPHESGLKVLILVKDAGPGSNEMSPWALWSPHHLQGIIGPVDIISEPIEVGARGHTVKHPVTSKSHDQINNQQTGRIR